MVVAMQDHSDFIVIGKFVGVYAVRGWLKVLSFTRPKTNILTYTPWFIKRVGGQWQQLCLQESTQQGKHLIASLVGVADREQAMEFVGSEIAASKEQLPSAQEGEFYWHQLIGMQVLNITDEPLGIVTDMFETGRHDLLVVEQSKQRYLIPYVLDVYIKEVDIDLRVMRVDWQSDWL